MMKSKSKWACLAATVLLMSLLTGCNESEKGASVIKYVNIDKVLQDSGLLGQEQLHLQAVKARLDTGAELARSRYETMEDAVKTQAMQDDSRLINAQWQAERLKARQVVMNALSSQATQMVSEEGLVAIMPLQGALAVSETMDITEQMSGRLKHHSLSFADLPEVSLKEADVTEVKTGK